MVRSRIVKDGLDRWIRGLDQLGEPDEAAEEVWRQVTDVMFDRSQARVHILTGDLKASGRSETRREGDRIVGEIEYDADHAIYEFRRGGKHDALGLAFKETYEMFRAALGQALEAQVREWK